MIENSDNAAGYDLFLDAGGNSADRGRGRVRDDPHRARPHRSHIHHDERVGLPAGCWAIWLGRPGRWMPTRRPMCSA